MRILFDTLEEKEEFIISHCGLDEDGETIYTCPVCRTEYDDIEDACDCCLCTREEVYGYCDYEDEE